MIPKQVATFLGSPGPDGRPILEYLAKLICLNSGNAEVTGFGNIKEDEQSPYGRTGITIEEAFHLTQLINMLKGILWGIGKPEIEAAVLSLVKAEVIRKQNKTNIYIATPNEIKEFT